MSIATVRSGGVGPRTILYMHRKAERPIAPTANQRNPVQPGQCTWDPVLVEYPLQKRLELGDYPARCAFLVLGLQPNALDGLAGMTRYPPEFADTPEGAVLAA